MISSIIGVNTYIPVRITPAAEAFTFWRLSTHPDYCCMGVLRPVEELHFKLSIRPAKSLDPKVFILAFHTSYKIKNVGCMFLSVVIPTINSAKLVILSRALDFTGLCLFLPEWFLITSCGHPIKPRCAFSRISSCLVIWLIGSALIICEISHYLRILT